MVELAEKVWWADDHGLTPGLDFNNIALQGL